MTIQQRCILIAIAVIIIVLLYLLSPVLMPFIISIILAYIGNPLTQRLEAMKLPRTLAVSIVFSVILLGIMTLLFVVIPLIFDQLKSLLQLLPEGEAWLKTNVWPLLQKELHIDPSALDLNHMIKSLTDKWQNTSGLIARLGSSITQSSIALLVFFINLFLIPVVTFYLLRDWDNILIRLHGLLPRKLEPTIIGLTKDCDRALSAFFKGQLTVMLALGMIYSVGLSILGLKFAILIGLMAGLVSIIPYMGFLLGFFTAIIVALFQLDSGWLLVGVVSVFVIGQILEGGFLTPNLVGNSLGLHPVAVMFALIAGGQLLGMVGMLVALPLSAIIMVLLRHFNKIYKESSFYRGESCK